MHFVDIWQGALPMNPGRLNSLTSLLHEDEKEKAKTFKIPLLRDRYIAVRGLLRLVLADYLDIEPIELQFVTGEHGKPALIYHQLYFNLSHSSDLLAIAVSDLQDIGIDIEQIKPRKGLHDIAKRCFSKLELYHWSQLQENQQKQLFYQLWTKKEAFVKALGHGISLGLAECEIDLTDGSSFSKLPHGCGSINDWKIVELPIWPDICGALVTPNVEHSIKQFTLDSIWQSID